MPSRYRSHESRDAAATAWKQAHPNGLVIGTFGDNFRTKAVVLDVHKIFLNVYVRDVQEDGSHRMPGYVLHRDAIAPLVKLLQNAGLVLDAESVQLDHLADQLA